MPRRAQTNSGNFVPHPRYGSEPIASGIKLPNEKLKRGFWRHHKDVMFPESVIVANPENQNYSIYPRRYYVDVVRTCRTCHRPFIFFAKEQRYWFETLKFFVDADCVLCPICRRESRNIQRRLSRYSDLFAKSELSRKELMHLVDDATFLVERGVLKNLSNVGAVKNRAFKEIPEYPGLASLASALKVAREAARAA